MPRIRAKRHWKQRFDPDAKFIWRRPVKWNDQSFAPGDPVPSDMGPVKLIRFWRSQYIELAEFDEPDVMTGRPLATPSTGLECPTGYSAKRLGGPWYEVTTPDGQTRRVRGKLAVRKVMKGSST